MAYFAIRPFDTDAHSFMDEDADRYESAAGWDGSEAATKRLREKARKKLHREMPGLGLNPFELASGPGLHARADKTPPAELFGPLWREGELAVLTGPAGSGKSTLAVQIADAIARGNNGSPPYTGGVSAAAPLLPEEGWPRASEAGVVGVDGVVLPLSRRKNKPQKVLFVDFERTPAQFF